MALRQVVAEHERVASSTGVDRVVAASAADVGTEVVADQERVISRAGVDRVVAALATDVEGARVVTVASSSPVPPRITSLPPSPVDEPKLEPLSPTMASDPSPPWITSLPPSPLTSAPSAVERLSPVILSVPSPPRRRSFPPFPETSPVNDLRSPANASFPLPPSMESLPKPPVRMSIPSETADQIVATPTINQIVGLGSDDYVITRCTGGLAGTDDRRPLAEASRPVVGACRTGDGKCRNETDRRDPTRLQPNCESPHDPALLALLISSVRLDSFRAPGWYSTLSASSVTVGSPFTVMLSNAPDARSRSRNA